MQSTGFFQRLNACIKNSKVKVLGMEPHLPMGAFSHLPSSQLTWSSSIPPSQDEAVQKFTGKQLSASVTCHKIKVKALVLHYDLLDFFPVFKRKGDMLYVGGQRALISLGQLISGNSPWMRLTCFLRLSIPQSLQKKLTLVSLVERIVNLFISLFETIYDYCKSHSKF